MKQKLLERYNKKLYTKELIEKDIENSTNSIKKIVEDINVHKEAEEVINAAILITQEGTKEFIESIVTKALQIVYDDSYYFVMEFNIKRNQTEITLLVQQEDQLYELNQLGGGVSDVVSLALRLAFYALTDYNKSNVFVLDEVGRNLGQKRIKFGEMMKELSECLGLQLIVVTHSIDIAGQADIIYEIEHKNGLSKINPLQ